MEELKGLKERQLRQVHEDFDRCHPADAQCAERQELIHEACEEIDRPTLEREEAACFLAPGCDGGEECIEFARSRSAERAESCTRAKS